MLRNVAKRWVRPHPTGRQSDISAVNCWTHICKGTCEETISALVLVSLRRNKELEATLPLSTCIGGGLPVAGDFL